MRKRLTRQERRLALQFALVLWRQTWGCLWAAITGRAYTEEGLA